VVAAIETIGTVIGENRLLLDEGLPLSESSRVRVIVMIDENGKEDHDEREWLRSAAGNESLAFLADHGEDIYTLEDGKPI
jgi:hypothetical protein